MAGLSDPTSTIKVMNTTDGPAGVLVQPDGSRRYRYLYADDGSLPEPLYASWEDYLEHTPEQTRRAWLRRKVSRANRVRLVGGRPEGRLRLADAVRLLEESRGRCAACGSLAVEPNPRDGTGKPILGSMALQHRVGTIDHWVPVLAGGGNHLDNPRWCCGRCQNLRPVGQPLSPDRAATQDDGPLFGLPLLPPGDRRCKQHRQTAADFAVHDCADGSWSPRRGVVRCPKCAKAGNPAPGGIVITTDGTTLVTPDGWWGV